MIDGIKISENLNPVYGVLGICQYDLQRPVWNAIQYISYPTWHNVLSESDINELSREGECILPNVILKDMRFM